MKKHHHIFLLIMALSVTILVTGIYIYMHYVVSVSIQRAATARDIVALERANSDREEDVKALHGRTVADRRTLSKFLIPEDRIVEFIESIEALGPQTGSKVTLNISATAPDKEKGTYGQARATVEAVGSWTSVMRALSLVENLPYGVAVYGVRLDSSVDGTKTRSWRAGFVVDAITSEASSTVARTE
jgi:hypothetical protein